MAMIDYAVQRKNMVESQVRPSDVTDRRIIRAMLEIAREAFVPPALRSVAHMDQHLPLAGGKSGPARSLLSARVQAKLVQLLELGDRDLVLDIGGATGYSAAVLSKIAQTVVALECDAALAATATETLAKLGIDNVAVVTGELPQGYTSEGPYDAILVNGAVSAIAPALLDQLKDGGRLVAVELAGPIGKATQWRRIGSLFDRRPDFDAAVPVLPGFEPKREFVL